MGSSKGSTARRGVPDDPVGDDLSPAQKQDISEIVLQHQDVFSEVPGRTIVAQHNVKTVPGALVCIPPYRIPEARRTASREEVAKRCSSSAGLDFTLPFAVHTDASEVGLGAVLSQVQAGEEHPVTYISRKLI